MTQWTVSFEKAALDERGAQVLEGYEYQEVERRGRVEVDLEEGEFFSFAEELESIGIQPPVDGSGSWGKQV